VVVAGIVADTVADTVVGIVVGIVADMVVGMEVDMVVERTPLVLDRSSLLGRTADRIVLGEEEVRDFRAQQACGQTAFCNNSSLLIGT
jgi:tetrahydromethanopterin S-methyltransferase subunit C